MAEGAIKVGVVGLGVFGGYHARHYASSPSAELVAVVDADAARATATAAQYGIVAFGDHRDLIGKVEAASVTAPASLHHAIARDLIDAGIHVLVEKPLATNAADARNLVALADKKAVVLGVGHIERYSPAVVALRERVRKPLRVTAVRRAKWSGRSLDVDVVLDLMIHDIDLALALAGSSVVSVSASGTVGASGGIDEAEAWLTFASGTIATLSASRVALANERHLTVTEAAMSYAADLGAPTLRATARRAPGAVAQPIALAPRDNLGAEIASFLNAIAGRGPMLVDGRAGLAAVEVADRIRAAIAEAPAANDLVTA